MSTNFRSTLYVDPVNGCIIYPDKRWKAVCIWSLMGLLQNLHTSIKQTHREGNWPDNISTTLYGGIGGASYDMGIDDINKSL